MDQPPTCRFCGYQVGNAPKFCPNCGSELTNPTPLQQEPPIQTTPQPIPHYPYTTAPQPQPTRPKGIIIISILWILGGLYNIYTGMNNFSLDASLLPEISSYSQKLENWFSLALPIDMAITAVFVGLGIIQLVTITGLLRGKRWSYYMGLSIPVVAFVGVGIQSLLLTTAPLSVEEIMATLPIFNLAGNFVFVFIYMLYLQQPHVKLWLRVRKSQFDIDLRTMDFRLLLLGIPIVVFANILVVVISSYTYLATDYIFWVRFFIIEGFIILFLLNRVDSEKPK
jgi:hypothetical protein